MTRFTRAIPHLGPALFFIALAFAWTLPLAAHLSTHIPGEPGDNLAFLWNVWWMREALASADLSFFHTDKLFAPIGIDLTLHTHTALPAWIAATALAPLSAITAQNLVILTSLALNGFAAYLLAVDRTDDRAAGLLAGLIFGGSPYIAAHLFGHFNLICAWGIPLFLMYFLRALEGGSFSASLAAGLCLVAIAFVDYYYLFYSLLLGAGLALASLRPFAVSFERRPIPLVPGVTLLLLLALDAALIAAVVASGGFVWAIGNTVIRANRPTNLLAVGWGLLAVLVLTHYRPRLSRRTISRAAIVRRVHEVWPMVAVVVLGVLPLAIRAWTLWQAGNYTAPERSWRSGPGGVDLATLVLGNPWHPLTGGWTRDVYARLDINPVEKLAWLGVVPLALLAYGVLRHRRDPEVRRWMAIGGAFSVWALGPWLRVAGFDTGLLLPQNFLTFVPVLSNARIPGRAMVVVFLATALVAALVVSRLAPAPRRAVLVAALVFIVLDYWPVPFPLTRIDVPSLYSELGTGSGTVCELPVGMRDGFGSVGLFDDSVLTNQMVHGHPIVGGFAARIPESIKKAYDEMPVVRTLFRLSAGREADPRDRALTREEAGAALQRATIEFVVLNRGSASPELVAYVESALPLELVMREGVRDLYGVYMPLRNAFISGSAAPGVGTWPPIKTSRGETRAP